RQAGGAADPRDEHHLVRRDAQLGEHELQRGEDPVVAAAGAPPHLLVGGEVLAAEGDRRVVRGGAAVAVGGGHRASSSSMRCSSSLGRSGTPATCVWLRTSTRKRARSSCASWPRLISGQSTFGYLASTSPSSEGSGSSSVRCAWETRSPFARTRRTPAVIAPHVEPQPITSSSAPSSSSSSSAGRTGSTPSIFARRSRTMRSWFSGW